MKMRSRFSGGLSRWLLPTLLLVACIIGSKTVAIPPAPDGIDAREKFGAQFGAALTKENFELLEKTAAELRKTKDKFPEGLWKLEAFYNGIAPNDYIKVPLYWYGVFVRLEKWKKAYPNSITQRVALARAYIEWAWNARGGGWANTVTPEGWKLFEERIKKAHETLDEAEKLKEKCPQWAAEMQTVALAEGWGTDAYEALYQRAVKAEPTYCTYYFKKAYYLLPRWHGGDGEWEEYANEAATNEGAAYGMTFYARIAWANSGFYSNIFKETGIEWPKMKQGFRDLEKQFPHSNWNLNAFCSFAFQAGDLATTRELLARIGDHAYLRAWPPGNYDKARRLAMPEKSKPSAAARTVLEAPEEGYAKGLSFSPDGKTLAAAYRNGTAVVWDLATKKPAWTLDDLPKPACSTAFSPDGKLLAVAAGLGGEENDGAVKVYDVQTQKERASIGDWMEGAGNAQFTADGKSLVMVGGRRGKQPEAKLWDVATEKAAPIKWSEEHNHHLEYLALSPNSKTMVVECANTIDVWDLVGQKSVNPTIPKNLRTWVGGIAFSPDGTMLATCLGSGWQGAERNKPGGAVIWNVADWKKRMPVMKGRSAGLGPVAFSPDSKLLASGGDDECVRVWEVSSGNEIATFYGHNKIIRSIAFSPDGKTIASSGNDGTIMLWDTPKL